MPDLLRLREAGGHIFVIRGVPGQAERARQQGTLVLTLQAQNRLECQAAGQEHGSGDDVQEACVQASGSGSWSRA